MKIFLAELGHTYFSISPATIPLGVGYVAAALKKAFGVDIEVRVFRYPEHLLEAIQQENPVIMGFGLYAWNANLSLAIASRCRSLHPETILVAGGLDIPDTEDEIERTCHARYGNTFDVYVPHEGELPMVALVRQLLGSTTPRMLTDPTPGAWMVRQGELCGGERLEPIACLDDIPSPYLEGLLDEMLADPLLTPVVQTMRGCPYRCTFCVSGQLSYSKMRAFSVERVKEELAYLGKHAHNRGLRITDDNFGLLERDVELAEFIAKHSRETGYPSSLKVYTDKQYNDRVRGVMLALKSFIPFNISLQSITPEVLRAVQRKNPSLEQVKEAFRWAKQNDMVTGTEVLHGLPGESYASFLACVDYLYELRVDSAASHEVWLLTNTKLSSAAVREQSGYETRYILGADAATMLDGELVSEFEEHVVASKHISLEEHYRLCQMDLYVDMTLQYGYFRELAYHAYAYGIRPTQVFRAIINNLERFPVLNELFEQYTDEIRQTHFFSSDQVYAELCRKLQAGESLPPTRISLVMIGQFVFGDRFRRGLEEYADAITVSFGTKEGGSEFRRICDDLVCFEERMIITPDADLQDKRFESEYDIRSWVQHHYEGRLSSYRRAKPVSMRLVVGNPPHFEDLYERGKMLRSQDERIQLFMRHTNSSIIRRSMM